MIVATPFETKSRSIPLTYPKKTVQVSKFRASPEADTGSLGMLNL